MTKDKAVHRLTLPLDAATLRALHKKLRAIRREVPEATQQDAIRALIRQSSVRSNGRTKAASVKG